MNTLLTFLAQGEAPDANPIAGFAPMILIVLIFIVFMFFMRRSQKRQEATHRNMVEELEKGTRVMLNSGLIARIEKIDKEAKEVKLLVDEDKKVYSNYSILAIAKVFEETKANVKKDD